MFVEANRYDDWLDPSVTEGGELRDLLVPAAPGRLEAVPVSTLVNDVKNNGPELIDPIPVADLPTGAEDALFELP